MHVPEPALSVSARTHTNSALLNVTFRSAYIPRIDSDVKEMEHSLPDRERFNLGRDPPPL